MTRTADLLQTAIEGGPVDHPRVRGLLPTAQALRSLSIACPPDRQFVIELGRRLQVEAAARPVGAAVSAPAKGSTTATTRPARGPKPVIILVGRGLPRLLAGVAASAIAVGGILGVASQSALPGQLLYPVKQVLGDAAVAMAGSDFDKGATLLGRAQDHIVEVSQLVDGPTPTVGDVNLALQGAIDDVTQAQQLLQSSFAETPNPQALLMIQDFSRRAIPQVEALHDRVPSGSLPLLTALRELLGTAAANAVQQLASCQTCGTAGLAARQSLSPSTLPNLSVTTVAGAAAGAAASAPGLPAALPGGIAAVPDGAAAGPLVPGGSTTVAPAPGVGGDVRVPSVNAGTGGIRVGGGGVAVTGPGGKVGVEVPPSTIGGGAVSVVPLVSKTCILGICP